MKINQHHVLADELLQTLGLNKEQLINEHMTWSFRDALKTVPESRLVPLVLSHTSLNAVHESLRIECVAKREQYDAEARAKRVVLGLMLSDLLELIHTKHLDNASTPVAGLKAAGEFYRDYLTEVGVKCPTPEPFQESDEPLYDEASLREETQKMDYWRLVFIRARRAMLFSLPLMASVSYYGEWVLYLDKFLGILAMCHALLLVPRFVTNASYVGHSLLSSSEEDGLSGLDRARAHLDMRNRWWELGYDFNWILSGALAAFILVGPLSPMAAYLLVLNPSINLTLHTLRYDTERKRYLALVDEYQALLDSTDCPEKKKELEALIASIKEKGSSSVMPVLISMAVTFTAVVTSTMIIFSGGLGLAIWVPFMMAVIAVAATIFGKMAAQALPKLDGEVNMLSFEPLSFDAADEQEELEEPKPFFVSDSDESSTTETEEIEPEALGNPRPLGPSGSTIFNNRMAMSSPSTVTQSFSQPMLASYQEKGPGRADGSTTPTLGLTIDNF